MKNRQNEYEKSFYKRVIIYIPKEDKKCIEKLSSVKSVSGYIKGLIRQDILNERKASMN